MKKPVPRITYSRTVILFIAVLVASFIIFILAQNWMLSTVRKEKQAQAYSKLQLIRSTIDLSLDQMHKLSQLLLLNNDIAKFIYQGEIPAGSYEIQTIIDAKSFLPTATSINAMLAEIYVYSNRSGYIISSRNAFLDPERMYASLFAFEGLNYRQFKSQYLSPILTQSFFHQTSALIHGRSRSVVPFVQTFPLNNPAANAGKIMLLLDGTYFSNLLSEQTEGASPIVYITDREGRVIVSVGDAALIVGDSFTDGQHRMSIAGKEYVLSVVSSQQSGLRFFSLLSLKKIHSMLSPWWIVLAVVSVGAFLALGLFSLYMLAGSNRAWNELLGLIGTGQKALPYEQAVGYIKSIVEQDRSLVREAGGTPFITDTFFRRLINGKMLGTAEIQAMLKQVQKDIDFSSPFSYQMVNIAIQEAHDFLLSDHLQDIDFTRIAAQKQAYRAFGDQCYLYMDYSFSIWIMLWHIDGTLLDTQIDWFWKEFVQVAPCSTMMAVSSAKQSLDDIFSATNECAAVQQSLMNEKNGETMKRFGELSPAREPYLYSVDMERKLYGSVFRGERQALEALLRTIAQDNFVTRHLGPEEHANLLKMLYATAIKISQTLRSNLRQPVFSSFSEAEQFFFAQAEAISRANNDQNDVLVQRIAAYIHDHYADPALNLSLMANEFCLKESFLYHFMQTKMKTSFAQYLETFRLEHAASLFAEKQMSIAEVATLCGYSNAQTFRRAFRKHYGMLPSDYQRTVLFQGKK